MTQRALAYVLAGAAFLALLYGVAVLAGGDGEGSPAAPRLKAVLAGAADSLRELRVSGPRDSVRLVRETPGEWRVNGRPADSAVVEELRTALSEAEVADLASTNPGNHARFGVAGDGVWRAEFGIGDAGETILLLGRRGPYPASVYVRLPDDERVYVLRGRLRQVLTRRPLLWRNRTVAAVDTAALSRVELHRDGESYALERSGAGWRVDGGPADSAAVERLLRGLSRMRALRVAPDTVAVGDPSRSLVALDAAGDTLAAVRFAESGERGSFWVVSSEADGVFEYTEAVADEVVPSRSRLVRRAGEGDAGGSGGEGTGER